MKKAFIMMAISIVTVAFSFTDEDIRVELYNNCGKAVTLKLPTGITTTTTTLESSTRSTYELRVGEKIIIDDDRSIEVKLEHKDNELKLCD